MSCSSRPSMWTAPNPLRKQNSCLDGYSTTTMAPSTTAQTKSNYRSNKPTLHKQLSVDQHRMNGGGGGRIVNNGQQHNNNTWSDGRPEASLRIFTAVKKRTPTSSSNNGCTETTDFKPSDRSKKTTNRRTGDDRINLNIFLSHAPNSQDGDCISDLDSEKETPTQDTKNVQETIASPKDGGVPITTNKPMLTAADRRAQFQLNKTTTVNNERKLVRAMSAPIRPIVDDSSSKTLQGKRRILRRKKNCGRERFGPDDSVLQTQLFFEGDEDDDILLTSATKGKTNAVATKCNGSNTINGIQQNRSRTTVLTGCDVVTLVSLLSSGGSDSEREDVSTATKNGDAVASVGNKAPLLSKSGKSVSFQEIDEGLATANSRELPGMFRRGSIAPLAARIRAKRPPTAPPGSIYRTDYDISDMPSGHKQGTAQLNDNITTKSSTDGKLAMKNGSNDSDSSALTLAVSAEPECYPEMCRSNKEKECWKLFQKMLNKGVNVSYDTILRGMLTPTELRTIQKQQKELEEQAAAVAAAELADTESESVSSKIDSKNISNNDKTINNK